MEQARQDFLLIWGERPLAPNWRRIAAIEAAQAQLTEGEDGGAVLPTLEHKYADCRRFCCTPEPRGVRQDAE